MNGLVGFLGRLGPARIAALATVTLALAAFFAFVVLRATQPAMGVLFSELSPQDAGAVIRELELRGVRLEVRADGGTILAPQPDLPRLRMELAGKGLPSGGGVGYELFDKGDAFSTTSFVQGINHLRALEGELARTIRSIGRVQAARVHLVIPERRLFERDREAPRASIALRLRGELESGQVRAIRHLVASAVEGLKPERISIVDERGRLLADGAGSDLATSGLALDEKQANLERRLRAQIEEIVAGVVGPGRGRIQVAAEIDQNRVESRSESFDPEGRVIRSTQNRTENQVSGGAEGAVSVANELPGASAPAANPAASKDASNKNEETTNYEISRTTRTEVSEGGRLKRLSVAVLVDGIYARGANGETAYQPRSPDDLERIATLVRTAIGFDKSRGDQVEVVNLRFADTPAPLEIKDEGLLGSLLRPTKEDVLRTAEIGVLALLTLIVLLTVVRPMVKRILAPEASRRMAELPAGAPALAAGAPAAALPAPSESAKFLDFAKVNGQVQAASIEQMGELVASNPAETVAVLRNWMSGS